jgi:hypothetical protein
MRQELKCVAMDLDAVAFPALIVADDGWVDYVETSSSLDAWTALAVKKYNNRRIVLFDHNDRAWLVESIVPRERRNAIVRVAHAVTNPKLAVQVRVRQVTESPIETIRENLLVAIDAGNDVLTQSTDAPALKTAIQNADSFKAVIQALREARAIDGS